MRSTSHISSFECVCPFCSYVLRKKKFSVGDLVNSILGGLVGVTGKILYYNGFAEVKTACVYAPERTALDESSVYVFHTKGCLVYDSSRNSWLSLWQNLLMMTYQCRPLSDPLKPLKAFILDEEPLEPLECLFGPLSAFIFTFEPLFSAFCPLILVRKAFLPGKGLLVLMETCKR